ncbi:hypothetical protein Tco_0410703 [Tanacetum coccineum]
MNFLIRKRRILLRYLEELEKLNDERVLKYGKLRVKEKEVQAIEEIEKRLKESELQQQESLITEGAAIEACLVIEGATLEACLVVEGIALNDNTGIKESSGTESTNNCILETLFRSQRMKTKALTKKAAAQKGMMQMLILDLQMRSINERFRNRLSEEFEPLVKNINLKLNCFEKSIVKEMKYDLKYVMSLEDEFDEMCLILDIQQENFKTLFQSIKSESYGHVYEKRFVNKILLWKMKIVVSN